MDKAIAVQLAGGNRKMIPSATLKMVTRRLTAALVCFSIGGCPLYTFAAAPKLQMHRQMVQKKNADGLYPAQSTKGHFSVISPIPFNDYTITTDDPNIGTLTMHGIGSKSVDDMEFGTIETVRTARQKDLDLRDFITLTAANLGAMAPAISVRREGAEEVARTAFEGTSRAIVMRLSKTAGSVFNVMCDYPVKAAKTARQICDNYVSSFRLKN